MLFLTHTFLPLPASLLFLLLGTGQIMMVVGVRLPQHLLPPPFCLASSLACLPCLALLYACHVYIPAFMPAMPARHAHLPFYACHLSSPTYLSIPILPIPSILYLSLSLDSLSGMGFISLSPPFSSLSLPLFPISQMPDLLPIMSMMMGDGGMPCGCVGEDHG